MVPESASAFLYCLTKLRLRHNENYTQDKEEYMVVDLGGNCNEQNNI